MVSKVAKGKYNGYFHIIWLILCLFVSLLVFYIIQSLVALEWPIVRLFASLGLVDVFGKTSILGTTVIIDSQCSGFFSIFVYLALIFSPITILSFKRKLSAFFVGFVLLYIANILRLFLIFWFADYFGLDTMHIFGWFLMSVLILGLWYYYNFKNSKCKSLQK